MYDKSKHCQRCKFQYTCMTTAQMEPSEDRITSVSISDCANCGVTWGVRSAKSECKYGLIGRCYRCNQVIFIERHYLIHHTIPPKPEKPLPPSYR